MIFVPPEWAPQKAVWTAWPADRDAWRDEIGAARREVASMVLTLAQRQNVCVLAHGAEATESAHAALGSCASVEIVQAAYWDIWLRDTGPIFARQDGHTVALGFHVNGWGGKFDYPEDKLVAPLIAGHSGARLLTHDVVLEGGSVEFDGAGRVLTTRQCLLNPNRNPGLAQAEIEAKLCHAFGIERVVWLDQGLAGDHTDGHIDNIARFVAPNRAVCQAPSGADDPNAATLDAIAHELAGQGVEVVRVPSPGLIVDAEGEPQPASHMNYIIGNGVVVVPVYEDRFAPKALDALKSVFPDREIIGLPAWHILHHGGGSFHCITQQEPA